MKLRYRITSAPLGTTLSAFKKHAMINNWWVSRDTMLEFTADQYCIVMGVVVR